jgi:hypothetical protein
VPVPGAELDAVTGASPYPQQTAPHAGAPTICAYCGELLVFDARLAVHRPTLELAARILETYPLIVRLRQDIKSGMFRKYGQKFDPTKRTV